MEEYHLMQRIKSPFVAKAYETFQDDKAFYFVTELLDTDIYKYMQKFHSVSKSQTSKIQNEEIKKCLKFLIASIFQSLEHIHEQKIIHKDIKPQNIMFDKDMQVKIIDFGISEDLSQNQRYLRDGGTLGYMAPEVLNKSRYSYQADFFAVGIIMYRLIMGKMPYQNRHDKTLLRREMYENQIEIDYKTLDQDKFTKTSVDFANRLLQTN